MLKAEDIEIGGIYLAKVGKQITEVRIERKLARDGWEGISLATNKKVRIKNVRAISGAGQAATEEVPLPAEQPLESPEADAVVSEVGEVDQADPANSAEVAKKPTKTPRAKAAKTPKEAKTPKAAKGLSCLDAAVEVLKTSTEPMACKAMIDAMHAQKLWTSDAPTPHATLYSAILREITVKGSASRFKKTDRGQFTLTA